MDMDYIYCKGVVKSKRIRESNWDRNEKKSLLKLVQKYRPIIDNKGNDNVWIRRKNAAWETIAKGMAAEGLRRGAKSARSQWARMKGEARKKQTKIKKETINLEEEEDDSPVIIPTENTDSYDCLVKTEECLQDEEMRINDSDVIITPDIDQICYEKKLMCCDTILTSIPSPNESSGIASEGIGSPTEQQSFPPPRHQAEKKFASKIPINRGVFHARLRQIEEETAQKAEMHAQEILHRQEIHCLRVKQMEDQIEQQRRLFEAQLEKLQSSN
ncbi:uncharacterized protein LOC129906721 [Episyrphus balteatus]|uniref:uncharacterized protein LOC129906721 n=1 Tax=Episyrphus balteatus TaxID=286459 RepID=UPI002484F6DE|nr:uncharacterized protein LOC129906721 [Episyrphus balteatus]